MPRPPVLPLVDFRALFDTGLPYERWLAGAEEQPNAAAMEARRAAIAVSPAAEGFVHSLPRPVHVLAIAEGWCGDVVRHVPVLMRLAAVAPDRVRVRFQSREGMGAHFARFLTNGGEAVPKFVFFSEQFVECGNWGPMPEECRRMVARGKAAGDVRAGRERVSRLYEADADGEVVQRELLALLDTASCLRP